MARISTILISLVVWSCNDCDINKYSIASKQALHKSFPDSIPYIDDYCGLNIIFDQTRDRIIVNDFNASHGNSANHPNLEEDLKKSNYIQIDNKPDLIKFINSSQLDSKMFLVVYTEYIPECEKFKSEMKSIYRQTKKPYVGFRMISAVEKQIIESKFKR